VREQIAGDHGLAKRQSFELVAGLKAFFLGLGRAKGEAIFLGGAFMIAHIVFQVFRLLNIHRWK
jgi:hypothetical protein